MTEGPSREDLLAVCTFARRFAEPGFVAGEWVSPQPGEDGVLLAGYWCPSPDVAEWLSTLHERHIIVSFAWTEPGWIHQMQHFTEEPSLLEGADLTAIRKVLTTLARAQRFREGTIAQAFEGGVPQAATRRLRRIAERMR